MYGLLVACWPLDSGTDSSLEPAAVDDILNRMIIASVTDRFAADCLGCHKYSLLVERWRLDLVDNVGSNLDSGTDVPQKCSARRRSSSVSAPGSCTSGCCCTSNHAAAVRLNSVRPNQKANQIACCWRSHHLPLAECLVHHRGHLDAALTAGHATTNWDFAIFCQDRVLESSAANVPGI